MNKKAILILLIAVALAFMGYYILTGEREGSTADVETAKKTTLVGFSMAEARNPWTIELVDHMAKAAEANDMEVIYHDLVTKTANTQLKDALEMLESGVDCLVLLPRVTDIITEIVGAAREKDTPVILVCDDKRFKDQCDVFITIDYEMEGRLCARALAQKYEGSDSCKIVEILGPEDSAIAAQRDKGFRSEIAKYPYLDIVATVQGNFNRVSASEAITDLISTMPKGSFQAVFACSDEDGLGALNALKLAGYNPGKEVSIVSINGIQDALKALIAGEYTATVASGKNFGEQLIINAVRLRNQYRKSRYQVVPYHVYDENSSAWVLNAALYW